MKHALVIGGSGMLASATLSLLQVGYQVSVVARDPVRLNRLAEKTEYPSNLNLVSVDYREKEKLQSVIKYAISKQGSIDLILAWIHSSAPQALQIILSEVAKTTDKLRLFHIVGSYSDLEKVKAQVTVPSHFHYRQVQLGFILEENHSRWLTNDEISNGVISAISEDKEVKVVGVLSPWDKRP